jgi:4-diphosphocytidyl-2-C-methyl-D-erythritol kinase
MTVGLRWSGEAPAKVNLFLRVLAREAGGYHQLETEYQSLGLSDTVTLERVLSGDATPEGGETAVDRSGGARAKGGGGEAGRGPGAPPRGRVFPVELRVEGVEEGALGSPEENLVVRAARAFYREAGVPAPGLLRLGLVKRIPHGAGLGGGSSDAARVLVGLNALEGHPLPMSRLLAMAGRLGADVPFFVTGEARVRGWGRGDRLLPLPPLPQARVLLLLPPEGIATPEAYRALAEHRAARGVEARDAGMVPVAERWEEMAPFAENDFEAALAPAHPALAALKEVLQALGAAPALLSGSGSAVFGVFPRGAAGGAAAITGGSGAHAEEEALVEQALSLARDRVPGVRALLTATADPDAGG